MIAHRGPHRRAGFTLLELLISAALTATLLALVWSLFGIYTKLNDRGVERAAELQLARALMQQFRSDLRNALHEIPRPAPPSLPATASFQPDRDSAMPLPDGAAMIGTPTSLQFLVRCTREPQPRGTELARTPDASLPLLYDQISYRWQKWEPLLTGGSVPVADTPVTEPSAAAVSSAGLTQHAVPSVDQSMERFGVLDPPGLCRRVTPWHLLHRPDESFGVTPAVSSRELPPSSRGDEELSSLPIDEVPEVARLRFRYLDGRRWRAAWDSRVQKRLPAAIEVSLEIEDPERHRRRLTEPLNTSLDGDHAVGELARQDVDDVPVIDFEESMTTVGPEAARRDHLMEYRIVIAVDPTATMTLVPEGPAP